MANASFYELSATNIQGVEVPMETYKGKTVVVVNTASKCGLTPQFEGLEKLYQDYKDSGLVILGFPCNQFAGQEPGDESQISEFCQLNYGVSFPMFSKIKVNGSDTHPIFKYLKSELKGLLGGSIKWNFTKFIIDKDGNPVKRFGPKEEPSKMEELIAELCKN